MGLKIADSKKDATSTKAEVPTKEQIVEDTTKAMAETKEVLESTPPAGPTSDEWGLKLTDRFNLVRQKESFMLIEHRPGEDAKGNPTTRPVKTWHPNIDQVLNKMARCHTLELLEQEEVDKFVDAIGDLNTTLRETVGPMIEQAQAKHDGAKQIGTWGDQVPAFLGRLKTALKVAESSKMAKEQDGEVMVPISSIRKVIEDEFVEAR